MKYIWQVRTHNFSFWVGGGVDPEATYNLYFDFKKYVISIFFM
jgi:hypothetical protein